MHLNFPYFTYLHLSRMITLLLLVQILSCTRNPYLLRKVIKKKRFVESCPIVDKVGKFETEKSDTVERKNRTATGESTTLVVSICHHCGNACEACYALSGSADLEHNFPDCNWEQSEWRSKRSAAKHERRVIQLAKSVDTQERQPAADDNCQR